MITSVHAHDIFDISQLILEKLGIDDQFDISDMGVEFGVKTKYREHPREGEDGYMGNFLCLSLRTMEVSSPGSVKSPTRTFAHFEIPIDYRVQGGPAYEKWLEKRKK